MNMKNLKLSDFEIYLLQESLKHYKNLVEKVELVQNSFITKQHVLNTISQLEETLNEKTIKEKIRDLNATT